MRRKVTIALLGGLCLLFLLLFYAETMPGYGIKSRWKKLLLKTLLSDDVPKISIADAHTEKDSVVFLDTREKAEYNVSHIEGALFAGYNSFDPSAFKDLPKDKPIITYCSIGKRSDVIAKKLLLAGYTNVQNLYGGIFEWTNHGYPVVDSKNSLTTKMHAYNKWWGTWLEKGEKVY